MIRSSRPSPASPGSVGTGEASGAGASGRAPLPGPPSPPPPLRVALRLIVGGAAIYLVLLLVGLLITRVLERTALLTADGSVNRWLAARRTPTLNQLTHLGTSLSDTVTAIVLTVLLVLVLRWWLGRWQESAAVLAAILGELFIFLLVTNSIGRQRPSVVRLDPAPPTSSFPSGHTAAAVALYGGLSVVVLSRLALRVLARVIALLCWVVPVVVACSRVYRGMHFPSDVLFGALGGGAWLVLVVTTLLPGVLPGVLWGGVRPPRTADRRSSLIAP